MRGHQYVLEIMSRPVPRSSRSDFSSRLRCCTDRLITAKDHAAIQISVADVDENGVAQSTSTSFAISGPVRAMGESDDSLNRLATKAGRESLWFWYHRAKVLTESLFSLDSRWIFFWDCRFQCLGTFGRTKSRYWLMYTSSVCPLYACYRNFVLPHLKSLACEGFPGPYDTIEVSALPSISRSCCAEPPAYNPNHLAMGGGNPPTSLADSILSTISVSPILQLSGT